MREIVAKTVEAGEAYCARCGRLIAPAEPFDLGHSAKREQQKARLRTSREW